MRLPNWVRDVLRRKKVKVEQYKRATRGRPPKAEARWFFCGFYWYVEERGRITNGPHGPFPCASAAATDALEHFGLTHADRRGVNII